jgi:glycosyltransferase involved in cell wall biosynthesis
MAPNEGEVASGGPVPSVSAIICTRNRAASLERCLSAMRALTLDNIEFELVIVDNGSSDTTRKIAAAFVAVAPFPARYVFEPRTGLSRARNTGIHSARGGILLFTDDDCYVRPDWVRQAALAFGADLRQVVGGRVDLFNPAHFPVTIKTDAEPKTMNSFVQLHGFVIGANMAIGRPVQEEIGDFDICLGAGTLLRAAEDTEIVYRAFKSGIPVRYEPAIAVDHDHGRVTEEQARRLMFGYRMGDGALALKYFLRKDPDPMRLVYWEMVSVNRAFWKGKKRFRDWFDQTAFIKGMFLFLVGGGWRTER